jgi:hypothetical protein
LAINCHSPTQDKLEKQRVEKQRAEKQRAEKKRAEKQRAEKQRAEKEKRVEKQNVSSAIAMYYQAPYPWVSLSKQNKISFLPAIKSHTPPYVIETPHHDAFSIKIY